MLLNPGVARFQHYAHETVAQILECLRTFKRVAGIYRRPQFISLTEAMRQRVDFLLSQGRTQLRALREGIGEALFRQRHLRLLATRSGDGVYAILLQSEPLLHRIRHLYGAPSSGKTVPTLIVAAFVGVALIILLFRNQAGNEHAGTVKSPIHVPDWTIFDDVSASEPTRLATSKSVNRVRTSDAALTQDAAETSGQVMREPVPLPRPRPRLR